MSNFNKLQRYISNDKLKIAHVEAVPRSISTALARALNEAEGPSVYVNEPFNRRHYDIEEASGYLLEAAEPVLASSEQPLTIVTKNMSRNLNPPIFARWMEVCDSITWSIRDPLVQMGSMVTRIANDLAYESGADRITQEELTPEQIQAVSNYLERGPVSENFSKTSWADMGEHFFSGQRPALMAVVDGGQLTNQPETTLATTCHKIGLRYRASMVEGWEGDIINANTNYNPRFTDAEHAWTGHAIVSTGIVSAPRQGLDPSTLPPALQEHITQVAIPIYQEIMKADIY